MGHWNLAALRSVPVRAFRRQPHHHAARPAPARIGRLHPQVAGARPCRGRHGPAIHAGLARRIDRRHRRHGRRCAPRRQELPAEGALMPDAEILGLRPATRLPLPARHPVARTEPYARSIIYFPPAIGARLRRATSTTSVVFRVLQRELGVRIDDVRMTVWAELATPRMPPASAASVGSALLVMQLLYRDDAGDARRGRLQPLARVRGAPVDPSRHLRRGFLDKRADARLI